jgi:membrane-associated phospholipid phosphatase
MADEIDFSRLYAGGHYLTDLTAGAFLGTAIGDYALHRATA